MIAPEVADRRLESYALDPDAEAIMDEIAQVANDAGGATLLSGIRAGRFLVEKLEARVFIMDKRAMLAPWRLDDSELDYTHGLGGFIEANGITGFVMPELDCKGTTKAYGGWWGVHFRGLERFNRAMCSMISEFERRDIGGFTVLSGAGQ